MSNLYDNATDHAGAGYRDIDPARVALSRGTAVRVIDVREPAEFGGDLGHAPGAELVPIATLETAAKPWNREQEIVLVCRSGARSARAATTLVTMGFRRPMNMVGGMMAWNAAQLEIEK